MIARLQPGSSAGKPGYSLVWRASSDKPHLAEGTTALLATRAEEEPTEFYLLGIYMWRNGQWCCEETFSAPAAEFWWVLEDDLLAALKAVAE